MRLYALPRDTTTLHEPRLDICLYFKRAPAVLRGACETIEDGLAPGYVGLPHRRQLAEQSNCRGISEGIGRVRVIDIGTDQMWLEHAVHCHQTLQHRREVPDMLA